MRMKSDAYTSQKKRGNAHELSLHKVPCHFTQHTQSVHVCPSLRCYYHTDTQAKQKRCDKVSFNGIHKEGQKETRHTMRQSTVDAGESECGDDFDPPVNTYVI